MMYLLSEGLDLWSGALRCLGVRLGVRLGVEFGVLKLYWSMPAYLQCKCRLNSF